MPSLTSVVPALAPALNFTPLALYERQRALVKLGLLPKPQGRGRGSGAEANAETVALLVIACLATDNLSDTDGRVKKLASARFTDAKLAKCPWTGERTFHAALQFLLKADETWFDHNVVGIDVSRTEPQADMLFHCPDKPRLKTELGNTSRFGLIDEGRHRKRRVICSLEQEAIQEIHSVLSSATK